ncbi:Na/Pi cotransporter family protein [Aquamicrobium sp. NLF2-7]|uniref:Na/Pi cotransporter family protein n=1 Tax=Aquamicrobium sp. NLF2-7 TaxID=2918753 RepID=UPI001EFB9297|nr:Na/Pi cotransporter family protein [Aquamicrobium sp. NLF2-7]MCG8271018.1 Na/Pi cotransporter family protein [Aquamicrobium sp. NLF2-7]
MTGSVVLIHLAGAVALMLYATRLVKTGVERAYGDVLRHKLRATLQNPIMAVLAGTGLAIALQSSTAVTLLVGSFAGAGIVSGLAGQLAVRGAEIGSALVAKLLTYDLTLLVPLCLIIGTFLFMATESRDWRQKGRILVGVGLLILSLEMIGQASEPLRESPLMPMIINYFSSDPITAYLLAALITWLFQSSIASVLLMATMAGRGLITPELGVVLVLGVNLGSSIIAPMLTRNSEPGVRIVPVGNLLMRGMGSIVMLVLVMTFKPQIGFLGATASDQIVNAHILFNVIILIAGLPLAGLVYRASEKIVALGAKQAAEPVQITELSALSETALSSPPQALANATREVVRVCETVEIMLKRIIELYENADEDKINALAALDDRVDERHAAIKIYLAKLIRNPLTEDQALRCQELIGACVKLEQVGDIIVRNMLVHVRKKMALNLEFTPEGWQEITAFHSAVLANARLTFNVLVSRDTETARQLVQEKDRLRDMERDISNNHFLRLRDGTLKSIETSSIHLDTLRDLKQINSLLTSIVYPVLEERGLLRGSRLRAS